MINISNGRSRNTSPTINFKFSITYNNWLSNFPTYRGKNN